MGEKVTYRVDVSGNAEKELKKINAESKKFDKSLNKSAGSSSKAFGGFTLGAAAATAAVVGLGVAAMKTVKVFAEFEKIKAVLTNTFSSKFVAEKEFQRLQAFALKTPFEFKKLAGSYTKLVNRGFKPTNKQLTLMGDLAATTGKEFDQLAEALLDAEQGEFERLKEFGIKAKKNGDQVALTFKGVTQEVTNTSDAIREAVLGLGSLEGVSGAMSSMEVTIEGKESALGDQWDQFQSNVGEKLNVLYSPLLEIASNTLGMLNEMLEESGEERLDRRNKEFSEAITLWKNSVGQTKMMAGNELINLYGTALKRMGVDMSQVNSSNIGTYLEGDKGTNIQAAFRAEKKMSDYQARIDDIVEREGVLGELLKTAFSTRSLEDIKKWAGYGVVKNELGQAVGIGAGGITGMTKTQQINKVTYSQRLLKAINELEQLAGKKSNIQSLASEIEGSDIWQAMFGTGPMGGGAAGALTTATTTAAAETGNTLVNTSPKTFNVEIENLVSIDQQTIMDGSDAEEFQQNLVDALMGALTSISLQAQ